MNQSYSSIDAFLHQKNTGQLAMSELQSQLYQTFSNIGATDGRGYATTGPYKPSRRDSTPTRWLSQYANDTTPALKSEIARDAEMTEVHAATYRM